MTQRHQDKVAVITGAASGIGRAYAVRLASEGAKIAIVDREAADEALAEVKAAKGTAVAFRCDISAPEQVAQLGDEVERQFGRCDILVNNAGLIPSCKFEDLPFEEWRRIMATNLDSVNAIAPGFTRTPGTLALGGSYRGMSSEQLFETLAQRQAIPRPPKTTDLVGTLSFLASDDAEFLTGQTLYVDGGLVRAA
jgi:NAD(P)-dependent dehydrogenase (short-subunit alcohol dehydrogenase family)